MSRAPLVFLSAMAFSSVVSAKPSREPDIATIDLRIGLSRSVMQPGYLAHGVGQGGFVELEKGHVVGALLPLSSQIDVEAGYLKLRQALQFTDRFAIGGCRFRPPKIALWFELEARDEFIQEPARIELWMARGVRVFAIVGRHDNALATAATALQPAPVSGLTPGGERGRAPHACGGRARGCLKRIGAHY